MREVLGLRDRQAQLTRDLVLAALADLSALLLAIVEEIEKLERKE